MTLHQCSFLFWPSHVDLTSRASKTQMLRLRTPGSRPGDTKVVSTPWPLGATGWVSLKFFKTQTLNSLYLGFQVPYQKLTTKTSWEHTYVTTYSPVELDACLPVTPGLGIALLHWHSRLKTWRCPPKQQLHPSSKTFFEIKISHALCCSSVMHIGGRHHAITASTSRMFVPFHWK